MLKTAPDPQDVQDIQFKLHCKLKIFSNKSIDPFSKKCSLLASASQYGLIFVGVSQSLHVIRCDDLEQCSVKDGEKADYLRRIVDLNGRVTHLSVNCDSTVLAVVTEVDNLPVALFYDIKSFFLPQIMVTNRLQISASPGTTVLDIGWNPAIPELFSVCKSDGSFGVYGIRKDVTIHELPRNSAATCFCWSPKGKLVAVGLGDRIVQHRPDLTQTRIIGPPPMEGEKTVVSLQWVSSFQFIAVYIIKNGEDVSNNVMVVDTPKTGELSYTNYYDICYSNLPARPTQFYMTFISQWNMLVVASSNSMEVGVLYLDKDTWKQLTLMDSARAELPLSSDHSDTLPVGFALDTSATQPLPWGEGSIPPAPRLFLLSHYGVLCCFNVVNLKSDVPSVCTPPQKIDGMALTLFTKGHSESVIANKNVETVEKQKEALQPHILKVPEAKMEQPVPVSAPLFTNQQSAPFSSVGAKSSLSQEQKFSFANIHPADPNQNSSALPKMNTLSFDAHLMKQASISSEIPKIVDSPVTSLPQVPKPQAIFPQKPEAEPAVQSEVQDSSNLEDKELMDLLTRMIKEECVAIESELNALLHQARLLDVSIGTDSEKTMLAIATTQLQEFLLEVVNNNTVQKSDVHLLKQNLIQTWAWLEEARSRYNASNDSTIAAILRAQPLDSAAEKQLLHIKHLMYYLESQLKQAHGALDEQWENFQDYCRKTYRTQLPTMEAIFQSMVKHNAILQKLTYNLKDISARINAHIQSKTKLSPLLVLDNLKKVEEDLKNLTIGPQDVFRMHYERILARNKLMSPNKTCKLRNYLNQTDVKHISSFHATIPKPQLQAVKQLGGQKSPSLNAAQTDKSAQVKPGAPSFLFQPDKSKESSQLLSLSKSHSFASAFVPTSNSTGLFDSASTAFKAVPLSLAPAKSSEVTNTTVVTPLTTASLFSNAPTKSLINKSVSASQIQAFNNPAAFSFTALKPSEAQPLKFDYQKPNITESSVIIIETANLQNTSTPKTFNFKLPTNEVSIIKAQASGSAFSVSKDTTSLQPAASVATVPTSTKVSVGKTCSTSFTSSTNPVPTNLTFGALNMTAKKEDQRPQTVKEISVLSPSVSSVSSTNPPSLAHQFQIPPSSAPTKSTGESESLFKPTAQVKENLFDSGKSTNDTVTTQNAEQTSHAKAFQNLSNLFAGSGISVSPVFNTTAISTSGIDSKSSSNMKSLFNITTTDGEAKSTDTATTSVATKSVFGVSSPSAFQSSLLGNSGGSKLLFGTTNYPTATTATITTATPVTIVASVTSSTTTNTTPIEDVKSAAINASSPVQVGNAFGSLSSSLAKVSDANLKVTNATVSTVASTTVTSSQDMNAKGAASLPASQSNIFGSSIKMPDASISTTSNQTISTNSTATVTTSVSQKATAPTTHSSIFGGVQSAPTNNVESQIGSPGSIFSGTPSSTTSKSIFGNLGNTAVSTSSVSSVTTSSVSSFFGSSTVSSTSSVFATPTTPSTTVSFSSVTTAGTLFGTSSLTTPFGVSAAPGNSSLFGSATTTTASPFSSSVVSTTPGIFGSTVSTNPSVFGTASSDKPSLFGSPAPTGSSSPFSSATTTATSSIFGSVASTAPSSPFTSSAVSVAPPAFGSSPISTANVQFGSSTSSVFGNTPATSAPFGSAVTSSAPSVFGAAAGKSIFGNTSTAFAPTGSIFGTPNSSAAAAASGTNTFGTQPSGFNTFGSANTTNFQQPSPFGSIFGTPASSAANTPVSSSAGIGTTSSFGNLTPQFGTSSSSSLFGAPAASTSNASFGFGGLNVSSTTASSQFGTNANPFAKASSIFGTPSTQSSSAFGGGSVFGSASQNTFGSQPAFGSASVFGQQQQSTFGQNAFGSSQPGPFSGGNSTVSQSGFGTPPAFQKPGGFGSPPVFGSSPSFGSAPSFGGAPAFGSSPTFGSPGKIFGGGSLSGSFQSTTQESSTFANLANQNTVGFGSLAQQAQNSSSSPFSANSSFSSWR